MLFKTFHQYRHFQVCGFLVHQLYRERCVEGEPVLSELPALYIIYKWCLLFQQFFPSSDKYWYAVIRNVQERNQAAETSHMRSSLELSEKLRAAGGLQGIPVSSLCLLDYFFQWFHIVVIQGHQCFTNIPWFMLEYAVYLNKQCKL